MKMKDLCLVLFNENIPNLRIVHHTLNTSKIFKKSRYFTNNQIIPYTRTLFLLNKTFCHANEPHFKHPTLYN